MKFYAADDYFRPTLWIWWRNSWIVFVLGWEWPWRVVRLR